MSQMATLTLADGQTTPVNKTFNVLSSQQGTSNPAAWANRDAGSQVGELKITQLVTSNADSRKTTYRVTKPSLNAEGQFSHQSFASITIITSHLEDEQGRKDMRAFLRNLLDSTFAEDAIVNGEPAY